MKQSITCIVCPQGCQLELEVEAGRLAELSGNKCPRGKDYAREEIENPQRVLTASIVTKGLEIPMCPVKTSKPVPKTKLLAVMEEVKKLSISRPVKIGEAIAKNILGTGADIVATRDIH